MAKGMVTTTISLPPAMLRALRMRASAEDRSVSSLVRTLIESPLDAWQKQQEWHAGRSRPAPRTSVAGAAGTYEA